MIIDIKEIIKSSNKKYLIDVNGEFDQHFEKYFINGNITNISKSTKT